jgi:hypothetical protein
LRIAECLDEESRAFIDDRSILEQRMVTPRDALAQTLRIHRVGRDSQGNVDVLPRIERDAVEDSHSSVHRLGMPAPLKLQTQAAGLAGAAVTLDEVGGGEGDDGVGAAGAAGAAFFSRSSSARS